MGDGQASHFSRNGYRCVWLHRIDLVSTRRRYCRSCLDEHRRARRDLHVNSSFLGTLAGTNPLRKDAGKWARPDVCTCHEHPLDTRDFDHLKRIGYVLDGDPALIKQGGKNAVKMPSSGQKVPCHSETHYASLPSFFTGFLILLFLLPAHPSRAALPLLLETR